MATTTVERLWPGATIVCIATGPSLTHDDVNAVRGKARVLVIKDAYQWAPWADVLWSSDAKWDRWHKGVPSFSGLKYSLSPEAAKWPGVQVLRHTGCEGLELSPTGVRTGKHSGYAAINCAVHLGASKIVLLGYDMQRGPQGQAHFFGKHPYGSSYELSARRQHYQTMLEPLKALNIAVVNATRQTALKSFPCCCPRNLDVSLGV